MAIANYDYSKQIENLKNAQQKAATAELQATRNQALSNLNAEQQQNAANYAAQRSTANAQNRLAAKNFQEYLANTGRANSGLGAQAAMQYNNNLNTSLNSIYGAENAANADILRRRTDAANAYNSGLAKANADIQANYIQALIDERAKRWDRDMQIAQQKQAEKEFQESVRQFNKNYELQKRNFSSGSGGGSSRRGARGSYGGYDIELDDGIGAIASTVPTAKASSKTTSKNTSKSSSNKKKTSAIAKAAKAFNIGTQLSRGPTGLATLGLSKVASIAKKAASSKKTKKTTKKSTTSKKTTSKNNPTKLKISRTELLKAKK